MLRTPSVSRVSLMGHSRQQYKLRWRSHGGIRSQ
ncbi:hypothetical protein E2C01_054056 [Portunus trituberculatus]|uniref:Uncharacterized protein n=1 Tax=Portunus trituberculatus TaxID=210409 RepID=A0A5B7GM38_PORTR|nr:hypothetical protein [Portunus trituberculatus]